MVISIGNSFTSSFSFPDTIDLGIFQEQGSGYHDGIISFCVRDVTISSTIVNGITQRQENAQKESKPNPELLNDWIFCHSHGHDHHEKDDKEIEHQIQTKEDYCLESRQELLSFLCRQSVGSKVLLESNDRMNPQSLFLQILSPCTHVFTAVFEEQESSIPLDSSIVCLFHFQDLTPRDDLVQRKPQESDQVELLKRNRLKSLRLSFDTEWIKVRGELLSQTRQMVTALSAKIVNSYPTCTSNIMLYNDDPAHQCLGFLLLDD